MTTGSEMSTPVTRGELREELQQLEQRIDQRMEQRMDQRFAESEARFDHKLEMWGGALLARIEASEQRLLAELARYVGAVEESMRAQIAALDEKYSGLRARVRRPKPSS
jgi:hypothetical protein